MSPKEIAEHILEFEPDYGTDFTGLARAYLELGNDYKEQGKLICRMGIRDMNQIEEITELKEENEKLKKSREVLRKALEFYGNWINSPDGIMHRSDCEAIFVHSPLEKDKNGIIVAGKKAREALKTANEIMEGK